MFCDQCGTQLQPAQQTCARCGKPVLGPTAYRRNRVQEHVRLVGILWMAYSALTAVGGVAVGGVPHTLFGHIRQGAPPLDTIWVRPLLSSVCALFLIKEAVWFFSV